MTQPIPPTDPAAPPAPPAQGDPATATPPAAPPSDPTDWKAEARKWEARAKANNAAADELTAIKDAQKTEAEKVAERLAAAEKTAAEATARVLRLNVALENKLTKEDAALLDAITDETAMRALAARLAQQAQTTATTVGAHVPNLGQTPDTPTLDAQIADAEAKGDTRRAIQLKTRKLMEAHK
ncbi:hypothetical protein AB0H43_02980 [Hamadaea sp. NPDC050747]|uniref:hypothetical protein n=1 Tax=Hamadaea sp. NPDC050747 TaxID=3155789 RepID=UPI003407C9D8